MRRVRYIAISVALGVLLPATASMAFAQVEMAESGIRRFATQKPLPSYPAASVAKGTSGVAVAAIVSGLEGTVTSVTILEAPDDAMAEAVRAALLAWTIPPVTTSPPNSRTMGLKGKVTFYFRVIEGRGRVFHPEDMPGGPTPEPASGPPSAAPGVRPSAGPPAAGAARPAPSAVSHGNDADIEIDEAAFKKLSASKPILLDIRERDDFRRQHRPGAVNIPGNELGIRSYIELERDRPVVIDCTYSETSDCHRSARTLRIGPKIAKVLILLP